MLALTLFFACTTPGQDSATQGEAYTEMTDLERAIHNSINDHRLSIGLIALEPEILILDLAREHSANMASGTVPFSHDGFDQRAEAIIAELPVQSVGENVAYLFNMPDPVTAAVEGWLNSPEHKANIEGDFNLTGLGASEEGGEIYLTQIFALTF